MIEGYSNHDRIERLFDEQVSRRGDRIAVSTADSSCDYHQLRAGAMKVAEGVTTIEEVLRSTPGLER